MNNKRIKPSFTDIRKALANAAFDPKKPGPMAVIADIDNPSYLVNRAIEFLRTENPSLIDLERAASLIGLLLAKKAKENAKAKAEVQDQAAGSVQSKQS